MSVFIFMTTTQADEVRGLTTPPAALDPVERQGGVFILGVAVLADPAHAIHHALLSSLPQLDSADSAFPPEIQA
ncbi:hypothetical protein [Reyranella sp.]|uniref:hypothetical protein n=1 Tax=Reyranella sp. TaxID=1929291 RepID=UPI003F6F1FC2